MRSGGEGGIGGRVAQTIAPLVDVSSGRSNCNRGLPIGFVTGRLNADVRADQKFIGNFYQYTIRSGAVAKRCGEVVGSGLRLVEESFVAGGGKSVRTAPAKVFTRSGSVQLQRLSETKGLIGTGIHGGLRQYRNGYRIAAAGSVLFGHFYHDLVATGRPTRETDVLFVVVAQFSSQSAPQIGGLPRKCGQQDVVSGTDDRIFGDDGHLAQIFLNDRNDLLGGSFVSAGIGGGPGTNDLVAPLDVGLSLFEIQFGVGVAVVRYHYFRKLGQGLGRADGQIGGHPVQFGSGFIQNDDELLGAGTVSAVVGSGPDAVDRETVFAVSRYDDV